MYMGSIVFSEEILFIDRKKISVFFPLSSSYQQNLQKFYYVTITTTPTTTVTIYEDSLCDSQAFYIHIILKTSQQNNQAWL